MNKINYVTGDATSPQGDGKKIIIHICNNVEGSGAWGAGFVLALSKKWKEPEADYRSMIVRNLGDYVLIKVEEDIIVCNVIGQEGIARRNSGLILPPIRYVAIEHALKSIANLYKLNAFTLTTSIHMPRIGSGLAGGNWNIIERIIEETICKAGISVTVYDLP